MTFDKQSNGRQMEIEPKL